MSNRSILSNGLVRGGQELLDPFSMRPYINKKGESVVTYRAGWKERVVEGKVVLNAQTGQPVYDPILKTKKIFRNAFLRENDWRQIDAGVLDITRQPLIGIDDLRASGLVQDLGGLGVSISGYERIGDMSPAAVSMKITPHKAEKDLPGYEQDFVPIPVIMKPFEIDIRTLEASQRNGREGLDVTGARLAALKVREAAEDMVFNGSNIQVSTYKIYGLVNGPFRIADTATNFGGGDFGTPGNAHKTIRGMISALNAKGFYGPFGVYISPTQFDQTLGLIGANSDTTELDVIRKTIDDLKFIKKAPKLSSSTGEVVVIQLTREVVDLALGLDVTPISWQEFGGLMNEFMVIAAMAPRFKADAEDKAGVAYASGA